MIKHFCKALILLISLLSIKLNAQTAGTGKITGKIIDAQNNQTIPFATAIVINRKTKATVKVSQSDINGNLLITDLPKGVFTFKISYVGYQTITRDSVFISAAHQQIHLGKIKIKPAQSKVLNEVNITAKKATMQLGIDKKVFSVDQSLVSEGGSASDLLENVPSVQTDMDGNVSLRGSTGVKVLIDGKPSLIAGGDVAQVLQSIPASSIESVELITNPSAKYDAEGQSGIINIVLKKNKILGLNGSLALTAGTRDNYNANTSLSFQNKKVNVYGNYSYRYGNRPHSGYNNITYLNSTDPTVFAEQLTDSKSLDKNHNIKAGLDYTIADKSIVSFSGGLNIRDNDRTEFLQVNKLTRERTPVELSNRDNLTTRGGNSYDLNLDFDQKFKKPKEELTFNFGFSEGENDNDQQYTTSIYNIDGQAVTPVPKAQTTDGNGINRNYNVQTDYSLPIGKEGKFEAGYRSQFNYSDNTSLATILNDMTGIYDTDYSLTNAFNSKEQIHAIYANYQNQIKNFGYQIGLRGEDAILNTQSGSYTSGSLVNSAGRIAYKRLYPSIFLTEKLKGEQQLQLSYSRRVNRPRGRDTNPFIDTSDPLSYRQGNPNLKPEDVHAFELSYSKFWPKVTFVSSAYFRQTNDVIQRVRSVPDAEGITLTTPQNLTRDISSGLELIGKVNVIKAWNFTGNVNLYQSKIEGVPAFGIVENSGFSWNANITNDFTLPYGIRLQVKADYNAPEIMAQGKRNAIYGVDAGAKYNLSKKASLSLNVRDVFNTKKWSMTTNTPSTTVDFKRYSQGTMAFLTFSYRFGQTDFLSKKTKKQDREEQPDQAPDDDAF